MKNKKNTILTIIAIVTLVLSIVGATYGYFAAQGDTSKSTSIKVGTSTTDTLTFSVGDAINITANQSSFGSGQASAVGSTTAVATLTANNSTNTATENYNVYLNISDNNFIYTQDSTIPELILTIKDSSNNEITSIDGLTYYDSISDNKKVAIKGFDITNKTGLLTLVSNHSITATPSKEETWTITITFVNYDKDQTANAGKTFSGQVLISKDSFEDYTPNTINTLSATKSGSNLTVNLTVDSGTNEIDKYYYAIEEKDTTAYVQNKNNTLKVVRLANTLNSSNATYVESASNSYTFTGINDNSNYEISVYGVDKKKIKTNTYNYELKTDGYVLPTITSVATSSDDTWVTATVTATKGTNDISKYYYSIDGGSTFVESTSNSYTFSNLTKGSNYRIVVKVVDSVGEYSNNYILNSQTSFFVTLAEYVISQYTSQGANGLYHHDGTIKSDSEFTIGSTTYPTGTVLDANDNSYRYAGASADVNNYVCLGSDESTCPDDNLYRIIGVFDGKVKLIKNTSIGIVTEVSSNANSWATSNLYKKLNGLDTYAGNGYIDDISSFSNKIATVTWKTSVEDASGTNVTAFEMYTEETTKNTNEVSAKIGLMYASEFGYGASPTAWSKSLQYYENVASVNWLCSYPVLLAENIINIYYKNNENKFFYFMMNGIITFAQFDDSSTVSLNFDTRPTFYLNSNVTYAGGTGSSIDPIRIGI